MSNKTDVIQHGHHWYKTLSGQSSLVDIEQLCARTMSEIFGYYAVQIGMLSSECDLLKQSRITTGFSLVSPDDFIGLNIEKNRVIDHAVIATNEQLPVSKSTVTGSVNSFIWYVFGSTVKHHI